MIVSSVSDCSNVQPHKVLRIKRIDVSHQFDHVWLLIPDLIEFIRVTHLSLRVQLLLSPPLLRWHCSVDMEWGEWSGDDNGGVGWGPESMDSVHEIRLNKQHETVLESEEVDHPGEILLMTVFGVDVIVGWYHSGVAVLIRRTKSDIKIFVIKKQQQGRTHLLSGRR